MIKKLLGGLCSALVVLGLFGTTAGSKAPFIIDNSFNTDFSKTNTHHIESKNSKIPVKFKGVDEIIPSDFVADYKSVTYRSISNEKATVTLSGDSIKIDVDEGVSYDLLVTEYYSGNVKGRIGESESSTLSCGSKMEEGVAYYLEIRFDFVSNVFYDDQLVLSVDGDGNLYFVKSPVYDYNVEMFSVLKTTDTFINTCLMPTKDMESDNEDVKAFAEKLCVGAVTDYEKVDRIYSFVTDTMIYDTDQADDPYKPYEDDVLSLIRRKIGVCEGFSNVFVALCRAMNIPATEAYGSAYDCDEVWALDMEKDVIDSNHAWVEVFIDGEWLIMDPTWDNMNEYINKEAVLLPSTRDFAFIPLESFSFTHIFLDADISHAVKSSGACGTEATYEIDKDGICTIYGKGSICMPEGLNDFFAVVFDESSKITEIEEDCFINCDLLDYIILPEGLERVDSYAFYHCENLEYVYIPHSVESIGDHAFYFCDKLAFIEVPKRTKVGSKAFDMCPRLVLSEAREGQVSVDSYAMDVAELIVRE